MKSFFLRLELFFSLKMSRHTSEKAILSPFEDGVDQDINGMMYAWVLVFQLHCSIINVVHHMHDTMPFVFFDYFTFDYLKTYFYLNNT